jgi:branched-chain amino acid transport system substrate-binding protein
MISGDAYSDTLYNRGFKYLFNTFITATLDGYLYMKCFEELNATLPTQIKTIAILYQNTEYPALLAEGAKKGCEDFGFDLVYYESYPPGTMDYSTMIAKIKESKPDVIMQLTYFAENVEFVKELQQYNVNAHAIVPVLGTANPAWVSTLGNLSNYMIGHAPWLNISLPGQEEVFNWYAKTVKARKLPEWPIDNDQIAAFDSALVMFKAIENAGTLDSIKIRDALATLNVTMIAGPVRFDERGVNTARGYAITQVQNGEWKIIWEAVSGFKYATAKIIYPKPEW